MSVDKPKLNNTIEQYVNEVTEFSDEYGSSGSISYTAINIIGKPNIFPNYGDAAACYNLRSYGTWWRDCPSTTPSLTKSPCHPPVSWHFIDLKFEERVCATRVDIYETYNAGSVVRICASEHGREWTILWEGQTKALPHKAYVFSPQIKLCNQPINMLRIEFNEENASYYCGFDAVALWGTKVTNSVFHCNLLEAFKYMNLQHSLKEDSILEGAKFLLSNEIEQLRVSSGASGKHSNLNAKEIANLNTKDIKSSINVDYFSLLPKELVYKILSYLNLKTLSKLSQTGSKFYHYVMDPHLYSCVDLKSEWWLVSSATLLWLQPRCGLLQSLDLSWCGAYGALVAQHFMEFVHICGHNITTLCLNHCQFIDNYCLYIIANTCYNLQYLFLNGCIGVDQLGFGELKQLSGLRRLSVARSRVQCRTLLLILQHISALQHLCIDHCNQLQMDEVCSCLSVFTPHLVSLSAWKTEGLTASGMRAIGRLKELRDLDMGWAISGVISDALCELLQNCTQLQRLLLTALRTLQDTDLHSIAAFGHNLQKLDIMGSRNLSPDAVEIILHKCFHLRLLDVSYCELIGLSVIEEWRRVFPHVTIKGGMNHNYL